MTELWQRMLLTQEEGAALLEAAPGLKARTLLMTAYAPRLRVSELCALRGRAGTSSRPPIAHLPARRHKARIGCSRRCSTHHAC